MANVIEELTKLAELRERGILTDAEFDVQKAQLLQAPPSATPAPPPSTTSPSAHPPGSPTPAHTAPIYAPAPTEGSAAPPIAAASRPDEQLMRTFVGPNADHYLGKWRTMEAQNKAHSWNWAAFLLSIYGLAYRKMFQPALIAAGAVLLLVVVGMLMPPIAALTNLLVLGVAGGVGWRGNTLYREHVGRSLARIEAGNPDPQARLAAAQSQGGVSWPAALALLAVWVVVVGGISYIQIARAQRALGATAGFAPLPGDASGAPGAVATTTSPGAPAQPTAAATATSEGTLPDTNPLWGTWENRAALTTECPQLIALLQNEVHVRATPSDQLKVGAARYTIQGSDVLVTTAAGTATARVSGGQMTLGTCTYTRPYVGR